MERQGEYVLCHPRPLDSFRAQHLSPFSHSPFGLEYNTRHIPEDGELSISGLSLLSVGRRWDLELIDQVIYKSYLNEKAGKQVSETLKSMKCVVGKSLCVFNLTRMAQAEVDDTYDECPDSVLAF